MQRISFPIEFQKALVARETDYSHLAQAMYKRGYRLSKQAISQFGTGKRRVPPIQLVRMCETLGLTDLERKNLHRAACRDQGYEI
jgi:hypothetical protein